MTDKTSMIYKKEQPQDGHDHVLINLLKVLKSVYRWYVCMHSCDSQVEGTGNIDWTLLPIKNLISLEIHNRT